MEKKQVFLLAKALRFRPAGEGISEVNRYDERLGINIIVRDNQCVPAITASSYAPTQSKTMQHGGDDDHDPDDEDCY